VTAALKDTRQAIAAPRAAAIAGVIFAALLIVSLGLVRLAVPADPTAPGGWLTDPDRRDAIRLALNLVPFTGVAFLWFVGVVRSRLGAREDQFLATVVLGSGLLFVACLFGAAALAGGLSDAVGDGHVRLPDSETYYFGMHTSHALMNVFAIKMAAVFMFSTCTIGLRTAILPRWVAFVGYACGLVLLVVITNWAWIALLFPLWVLLVSAVILTAEFRGQGGDPALAAQAANPDNPKPAPARRRGDQERQEDGRSI
jgi:hypothetical protein